MTLKGGTTQACAACKFQRRKCTPECVLAPHFPAEQPKIFQNVHKLFGVSNIVKILKVLEPCQRKTAMESIITQSNYRDTYPVHGCLEEICKLQYQIWIYEEELNSVHQQLEICRQQYSPVYMDSKDNATNSNLWLQCPYMSNNSNLIDMEANQLVGTESELLSSVQQGVVEDGYDEMHRFFDTVDDRQSYIYSKEAYESSWEKSVKDRRKCSEHVSENELKSAAACFSLTSVN